MTNSTNDIRTDGGEEPTHRVVGKSYSDGERTYEPGDLIAPSDHTLEVQGARFEPLPEDEQPESQAGDESDDAEPEDEGDDQVAVPDVGEMTNDEVAEYVADQDDPRVLEAMLEDEQAGDDREGATSAIEDRLAEVTE